VELRQLCSGDLGHHTHTHTHTQFQPSFAGMMGSSPAVRQSQLQLGLGQLQLLLSDGVSQHLPV
jgi:hypothetical protein